MLLERLYRESHSHGDDKRHAFRDADSEKSSDSATEVNCALDGHIVNKTVRADKNVKEPNNSEEDKGDDADHIGVGSNNLCKGLELVLEWRDFLLDLKSVVVRIELLGNLQLLESVIANSENESLATS